MALTAEELISRGNGLGASESAPAVGLSKWCTPYRLWRRKLGLEPPDEREELYLEMGQVLEPMIIGRAQKKLKIEIVNRQLKVFDPENPWRWVTLDGQSKKDGALIEAKSVGMANPAEWGEEYEDDAVPMEYYCQIQHGLACIPTAPYAWLPLIVLNRQFRIYRVQRDPEMIDMLTKQEALFLTLVQTKTEPPPLDLEDVSLMWPGDTGTKSHATNEIADTVLKFKALKEHMKVQEKHADELKLIIASHMRDASELVFAGKTIATFKQPKDSQKFDKDKFQIDHPAMYERYCEPYKNARRMLLK